ncbi:trans-sialidase, partial [Trypanosoma cruzi]
VSQSDMKVHVSRPTTVVNGRDIYMLVGKYTNESAAAAVAAGNATDGVKWGLLLVKGNVSVEGGKDKRICWRDTYGLPWGLFGKQDSLTGLIGSGGSGVNINDGTLVFPVEGTKNNGKTVSLIIYSSDIATWKLSKGMSAEGCGDPCVVEWKGKLMMMTACDDGRRRVYESGDKGSRGRRHSGHSRACGATNTRDLRRVLEAVSPRRRLTVSIVTGTCCSLLCRSTPKRRKMETTMERVYSIFG